MAVNVAVGSGGVATVTVTGYSVVPPAPVRVKTYVVVNVRFTTTEPLRATVPTPKLIEADVAFCEDHVSVACPPPNGNVVGAALIVPVGALGLTTTPPGFPKLNDGASATKTQSPLEGGLTVIVPLAKVPN